MKLVIINGSPKGDNSVTYQYMRYIRKHLPNHEYTAVNIGANAKRLENDSEYFESILHDISTADGIFWVMPVYYFLVPFQVKRFVELVNERGKQDVFSGKFAATILTSVHFFDHFAEHYLRGISEDWGMSYFDSFLADMNDLLKPERQRELVTFGRMFEYSINSGLPIPRSTEKLDLHETELEMPETTAVTPREDKTVVLITDGIQTGSNLEKMAEYFTRLIPFRVDTIDLSKANLVSGCIGCMKCGFENQCVFNDDVKGIIEGLAQADVIVYALTIRDRYFSSIWKKYLDRNFMNNHVPVIRNKQMLLLAEGPLAQLPHLKDTFITTSELGGSNFIGVVSDDEPNEEVCRKIEYYAKKLEWSLDKAYFRPPTFLGHGGKLIFRDLVFESQGFVFKKDYDYYKRNGMLRYPHNNRKSMLFMRIMGGLTNIPSFRKKVKSIMEQEMVKSFKKVVEE